MIPIISPSAFVAVVLFAVLAGIMFALGVVMAAHGASTADIVPPMS